MFYASSAFILLTIFLIACCVIEHFEKTTVEPFICDPSKVTDEMMEFWGLGFSPEYYMDVQRRYNKFMEFEEGKIGVDVNEKYKELCASERKQLELLQNPRSNPSDIKAVNNMISKLSEDLNIKTLQKKQSENDAGKYIITLTTKYIEEIKKEPTIKNDFDWLDDVPREEMAYFLHPLYNFMKE